MVNYGLKLTKDGYLTAEPAEKAIIKKAQKMRAQGLYLCAISAKLAQDGHLSRMGHPFTAGQISRMLTRRK